MRRLSGEAAKFSAVNGAATAVAVVLFNVLVHGVPMVTNPGPLNTWPVTAWFVANCVGMVISFYGSRRYAFKHRRPSGLGGGALNYAVVNLASFTIPMACLWATRNLIEMQSALVDNLSANVVGAVLGMLFRFWAFRRFVFKRQRATVLAAPELRPYEPQLLEEQAQQGKADPDDVVGVAGHA